MNHPAPIHRPPAPFTPERGALLPAGELGHLTPAQQTQLRALVAHAIATVASSHPDHGPTNQIAVEAERRSPLAEPGVLVVLVMLALVATVAIVALVAVFGLAVAG